MSRRLLACAREAPPPHAPLRVPVARGPRGGGSGASRPSDSAELLEAVAGVALDVESLVRGGGGDGGMHNRMGGGGGGGGGGGAAPARAQGYGALAAGLRHDMAPPAPAAAPARRGGAPGAAAAPADAGGAPRGHQSVAAGARKRA